MNGNEAITITITPTVEGWSIRADRRDTGEAREDTANRVLGRHADGSEAVVILGNRPSLEAALRSIGRNLDHGRI